MIVYGAGVAQWVLNNNGNDAIGWMKDGRLVSGFAISECNGKNAFVHIRLEGRTSRQFWFAMVDWVYNQIGCEKMTAPVAATNEKCLKLLRHMGWTQDAVLKDAAHDQSDMLFLSWHKKDCYILNWNMN
jgi:RimJ/RimL family protein N-acetyltransferase